MTPFTFKMTEDKARLIRARAGRVSVSEYLRRRVRCPHTGAMIFSVPKHQSPLTTGVVRELLSDFP